MPIGIHPKVFVAEGQARWLANELASAIRAAHQGGQLVKVVTLNPSQLPERGLIGEELEPPEQVLRQAIEFAQDNLGAEGIKVNPREVQVSPAREGRVVFDIVPAAPPFVARGRSEVLFQRAVLLEKGEADELHDRITQELVRLFRGTRQVGPPPDVLVRVGNTRHVNQVWGEVRAGEVEMTYKRLDSTFCMNDEAFRALSKDLRRDLGGNVLKFRRLSESMLGHPSLGGFTTTSILGASQLSLAGRRWIGSGAGDGVMELMAAKSGATSLDLIDYNPALLEGARDFLTLNDLEEGKHFRLVPGDLTHPEALAERLAVTGEAEVVVASNIGQTGSEPWPEYTVTNAHSIELASAIERREGMPRVAAFVAGGYYVEFTEKHELSSWQQEVYEDIARLEQLGFAVATDSFASIVNKRRLRGTLAFVATR